MKQTIKESKLRKIISEEIRNILKEEQVIVTGDRGQGKYEVDLIKQYKGKDVESDETVYIAKITKIIKNFYDYKIGDKVYAVKDAYDVKGTWGGIDPFINTNESVNLKSLLQTEIRKALQEKWDTDYKVSDEHKGEWEGYSEGDLKSTINNLRDKKDKSIEDSRKLKAAEFALRSKVGWNKKIT